MKTGILNIGLSVQKPLVKIPIPFGNWKKGLPFLYESDILPESWGLVNAADDVQHEIDLTHLTLEDGGVYYNGGLDLVAYFDALGVDICNGYYYFYLVIEPPTIGFTSISPTGTLRYDKGSAYGELDFTIQDLNDITNIAIWMSDELSYNDGYRFTIVPSTGVVNINKIIGGSTSYPGLLVGTFSGLGDITSIKIKRNSTTDEFVTGAIGTTALYLNDTLPTVVSGSMPFTNNDVTDCNYVFLNVTGNTATYNISDLDGKVAADVTETFGEWLHLDPKIKYSQLFEIENPPVTEPTIGRAYSSGYSEGYS